MLEEADFSDEDDIPLSQLMAKTRRSKRIRRKVKIEHEKATATKDIPRSFVVFLFCCIFRLLNVWVIRSQFDPDEYWQNLEPAYCHVFGHCDGLTWEWKRRSKISSFGSFDDFITQGFEGPIRSYVSILPTILFYYLVKYLKLDSTWMVSKGPVVLNAIIVAAPTDWAVWRLSRWMEKENERPSLWYLYASLMSWFHGYALIRTYSNSLETFFLIIGLFLVGKEFLGRQPGATFPTCLAFYLGGICCSIRFTCLASFVPMGLILSLQRRSTIKFLFGFCLIPGLLGLGTTLLIDRYMYGFWAIPVLGNIHFNVILGNGSLYGTHPLHWYMSTGLPVVTGLLVLTDLFSSWTFCRRNLLIICICYIAVHSYSEHKEFRFLLPLLPLFCLLSGEKLRKLGKTGRGKILLALAGVINVVVVLYLGLIHQRGVISVNREIVHLVHHEPQTYTIHYLMGCHSTPLLSHLHAPPVKFETWTLDCGPDCRSNPKVECESDSFSKNPGQFMEQKYFHCSDVEVGTCVTDLRIFYPDFLVARSGDLPQMKARIATMNMREVGRFMNGIKGAQVGNNLKVGNFGDGLTILSIWPELLTVSVEEIVLFQNRNTKPRY